MDSGNDQGLHPIRLRNPRKSNLQIRQPLGCPPSSRERDRLLVTGVTQRRAHRQAPVDGSHNLAQRHRVHGAEWPVSRILRVDDVRPALERGSRFRLARHTDQQAH
jgi:hypothetical protein